MKIFKRIFGICETKSPENIDCWRCSSGRVKIELSKAHELKERGTAIRLEGKKLANRLLVVHGSDYEFNAFENKCTHSGRRLDPLSGQQLIQCCSAGKSTFDYTGADVSGTTKEPIKSFPVEKRSFNHRAGLTRMVREKVPRIKSKRCTLWAFGRLLSGWLQIAIQIMSICLQFAEFKVLTFYDSINFGNLKFCSTNPQGSVWQHAQLMH